MASDDGIGPLNKFCFIFLQERGNRSQKSKKAVGQLHRAHKEVRLVRALSEGMVPVNALRVRISDVKSVRLFSAAGSVPARWFRFRFLD